LQKTVHLSTYSQLVCVKFAGYNLQASQVTIFIIPDVQIKSTYLFIIYIYTKFHIPSSSISLGIAIQTGRGTQWHSWLRYCNTRSRVRFLMASLRFFI